MNASRMLKLIVVAALGALVVGSLAGLALARNGSHHSAKRHHRHHHHHGAPAGTIASFDADTGTLTIALTDGDSVSGEVTNRTRIRCEDEHSPDITRFHRGEDESGDDHGGQGEEEPGDDHGGQGDEPGDDHHDGDRSGRGPSGHDDNGSGANCTTADLIVGAVVDHAELELEHGSATFDEVELDDLSYLASSQSWPTPTSTSSGGSSW
jgi:hypothetical protein